MYVCVFKRMSDWKNAYASKKREEQQLTPRAHILFTFLRFFLICVGSGRVA